MSRFLGPWDVITPITPIDELVRAEQGVVPRNYLVPQHQLPASGQQTEQSIAAMLGQAEIERKFYNHCPATEIKAAVGNRIWNSYTKFCFERSPWDRVLSEFHFLQQTRPAEYGQMELSYFVRNRLFTLNSAQYLIDDRLAVDHLCCFENLTSDLTRLCQMVGLPYDGWLPRTKSEFRKDRRKAAEVMSPELLQIITESCAREIELLGYQQPVAA